MTTYQYDADGRLSDLQQTAQGGNPVADKHVAFEYNGDGQFATVTRYASLDKNDMVAVSDYTYDQYGRLTGLVHYQDPADPLAQYSWTYQGGGQTVEFTSADSQSGSSFGFGSPFGVGGSLLEPTATTVAVNPLPDYVWTFDSAFSGRLVQMTSSDGVADYSYDARGQLTGASYDYQEGETYSYDANGNRTNPGYVTGDHNRLLSDGTYNYEYDAEGNRTKRINIASGEVTEYVWDHRNRLVQVIDRASDDGPIVQSVEYVYDSQNRWIGRSIDADGDGPVEPIDTYFVYDGGPAVPQASEPPGLEGGQIILQLAGAGHVTHRYLWGPAVDQILADEQLPTLDPGVSTLDSGLSTLLWPLTDHLNTVRDLAQYNAETGTTTVVNHLVYDAFGNITRQADAGLTTLFAFTARPYDLATGLQNNLNRWYDPRIGRWLSEDPIGFAAGDGNLYRCVGNALTNATDPTGLDRYITHFDIAGLGGSGGTNLHVGVAVDLWRKLPDGTWRKIGATTFDFSADWDSVLNLVCCLVYGRGRVTQSKGITLSNPITIPSYPEEDIAMLNYLLAQKKNPAFYSALAHQCLFWAVNAVNVGIDHDLRERMKQQQDEDFMKKLPLDSMDLPAGPQAPVGEFPF